VQRADGHALEMSRDPFDGVGPSYLGQAYAEYNQPFGY
jgi:hypothetical protein